MIRMRGGALALAAALGWALPAAAQTGRTVPVETVRVETIEGVEIYRGVASLPAQFNREGAECGVIVVWSRGTF
jgi:hypothetical protein